MRLTEENMCVWAVTWNLLTCFAKVALDFFYFSSWKKLVKLGNVCSGFPSFLSPAGSCCVLLRLTCGWVPNHLLGILGGSWAQLPSSILHLSACLGFCNYGFSFPPYQPTQGLEGKWLAVSCIPGREQGCCSPSSLRH